VEAAHQKKTNVSVIVLEQLKVPSVLMKRKNCYTTEVTLKGITSANCGQSVRRNYLGMFH